MPRSDLWVSGGGPRLAVRDYGGSGDALLLLHGGGGDATTWDRLAERLVPDLRVVAYDARGHGRSATPPAGRPADLVGDVDRVADAMRLVRPVLVGHSMGGVTALRYARANPPCRAVVCIDGAYVRTDEPIEAQDDDEARERLRAMGVRPDRVEFFVALGRSGRDLARTESVALYDEIECPLLLLCAERGTSNLGPYTAKQRAALAAVPAETHWLDAGHELHEERPEEVALLIRRFAAALP